MLWRAAGRGGVMGGEKGVSPGPARDADYGQHKSNPGPLLWDWIGFGQQAIPYTGLLHAATTS